MRLYVYVHEAYAMGTHHLLRRGLRLLDLLLSRSLSLSRSLCESLSLWRSLSFSRSFSRSFSFSFSLSLSLPRLLSRSASFSLLPLRFRFSRTDAMAFSRAAFAAVFAASSLARRASTSCQSRHDIITKSETREPPHKTFDGVRTFDYVVP